MNPNLFQQMQSFCNEAGWSTKLDLANEQQPFHALHIVVPSAADDSKYEVRLIGMSMPGPGDEKSVDAIDMMMTLPFEVEPEQFSDTTRLLSALNAHSTLGFFCLSEIDGRIAQRLPWTAPRPNVQAGHLIPMLKSFVDTGIELRMFIEPIATGSQRYDELLAQARADAGLNVAQEQVE